MVYIYYGYTSKFNESNPKDLIPIKVIEVNEGWIKFSLKGRHIVLPKKLMVEEASQKDWDTIVNKKTGLPHDYGIKQNQMMTEQLSEK